MTSATSTFSSAHTCSLRCRPSPSLLCSPWRRPRTASPRSPPYVWLSSGNQPGFLCCGMLRRRTHLHLPWIATRKKIMHCFVISDVLHFNKSKTSKLNCTFGPSLPLLIIIFPLYLLFLQHLHVGGKGQGKPGFLRLDADRPGTGQTPPHVRHDQQIQARTHRVCDCGGQRQVRPLWAVQWHCQGDHPRLKRGCWSTSVASLPQSQRRCFAVVPSAPIRSYW